MKIDWKIEPCIYECGHNKGYKQLTIEESIENNFWKDGILPINIPEDKEQEKEKLGENMAKNLVFRKEHIDLIFENKEIFQYEYPEIPEKDWVEFESKPSCNNCRRKVIRVMRNDTDKMNSIFSAILGEEINFKFPGKLEYPIIEEFGTVGDMQNYIARLKSEGKIIESITPSPNGQGGYLLVVT